jgi:hypothetical protein
MILRTVRILKIRTTAVLWSREGYTQILPLSIVGFPLWDLLFVLKARVEHITRASPDVQMFQMFIVLKTHSKQSLERRNAIILSGKMIPTINRVVHHKWPHIERNLFRPMKDDVQHHRERH